MNSQTTCLFLYKFFIRISSEVDVDSCSERLRQHLEQLNNAKKTEIDMHFFAAVENILSATRYERLNPDGPKLKVVSATHPLVPQ